MKWQPIESAPKDGTKIVLAQWSEYSKEWHFGVSYWRKYLVEGSGFGWVGYTPTHWTLPPPKEEEHE